MEGLPLGDAIRSGGELGGGGCETGKPTAASRGDADPRTGESEANADTGDCVT